MRTKVTCAPVPNAAPGADSFANALTQATGDLSGESSATVTEYGPFVGLLDTSSSAPSSLGVPSQLWGGAEGPTSSSSSSAPAGARRANVVGPPLTATTPSGASGRDVVGVAEQLRGVPYVWGGTSPQGFDCSGFVQYVYARLGITLPRTSEQQALVGTPVPCIAQAKPGDLLFFAGSDGTASSPGHVGIYVGDGEMIDAPYTGTSVQVQALSSAGDVVAIRRVLGTGA